MNKLRKLGVRLRNVFTNELDKELCETARAYFDIRNRYELLRDKVIEVAYEEN